LDHQTSLNSTSLNSSPFNPTSLNSSSFNSTQLDSTSFNPTQPNSIHPNLNQPSPAKLHSARPDPARSDSIQFNSIQFNSIQFNSIQFNSIQFNSIQFNSIQPLPAPRPQLFPLQHLSYLYSPYIRTEPAERSLDAMCSLAFISPRTQKRATHSQGPKFTPLRISFVLIKTLTLPTSFPHTLTMSVW